MQISSVMFTLLIFSFIFKSHWTAACMGTWLLNT
uniref:Uncharacterized protein n=1 Tax=Anguilla anguilla TaxID=7936 RepID=A0A0E9PZL7_ANGAN